MNFQLNLGMNLQSGDVDGDGHMGENCYIKIYLILQILFLEVMYKIPPRTPIGRKLALYGFT